MTSHKEPNEMTDEEIATVLDFGDIVNAHVRAVRSEGYKRAIRKTGAIAGYKIASGAVTRDWADDEAVTVAKLRKIGVPDELIYRQSLASPAQIEAALKTVFRGKKEALVAAIAAFEKLVKKTTGGQTALVRDIDPRPAVKRGQEFKGLAEKYGKGEGAYADDLL